MSKPKECKNNQVVGPTSLFEAAQQGMKMDRPEPMITPPKTAKDHLRQLVGASYELVLARQGLKEAEERCDRFQSEIQRAQEGIKTIPPDVPHTYLVKTQVDTKIVLVTSIENEICIQVLDVEEV